MNNNYWVILNLFQCEVTESGTYKHILKGIKWQLPLSLTVLKHVKDANLF